MRSRFISNLSGLLLSAALVALALALAPAVVSWIAVGVGAAILVVTAFAFLSPDRGIIQRALDAPVVVLAAWTIVAVRVLPGATVHWIAFGDGLALAALTAAGLIAHEALNEQAIDRLLAEPTVSDRRIHDGSAAAAAHR